MSEMVRAMVAGEDNRRSFDCGRDATFAQDDASVGCTSEEQMRGFFAPLRMTSEECCGGTEADSSASLRNDKTIWTARNRETRYEFFAAGRKISSRRRQAPMTMQLSATLKSGQL